MYAGMEKLEGTGVRMRSRMRVEINPNPSKDSHSCSGESVDLEEACGAHTKPNQK